MESIRIIGRSICKNVFQSRCRDLVDGKVEVQNGLVGTFGFQSRCRDLVDGKQARRSQFSPLASVSVPLPGFS